MFDIDTDVLYLIALVGIIGLSVGALVYQQFDITREGIIGLLGFVGGVGTVSASKMVSARIGDDGEV